MHKRRTLRETPAIALLCVLLCASATPAQGQVDRIVIRTTGISCGMCAAAAEWKLRRVPGVEKLVISLSSETVTLTLTPGADFAIPRIRAVLQSIHVGVERFTITARGRIYDDAAGRFFVAGQEKFRLIGGNSRALPARQSIRLEAVLDDQMRPMQLNVVGFSPSDTSRTHSPVDSREVAGYHRADPDQRIYRLPKGTDDDRK